jgi:hypothetical protein
MRRELPRTIQNGGYRVIRQLSCKHSNQVDDTGFDGPSGVTDLVLLDPHLRVVAALPMDDQRQSIIDDIDDNLFDEQPDDLLARLNRYAWTVPCLHQVLAQSHQPGTVFIGQLWRLLGLIELIKLHLQIPQLD